MPSYLTEAAIVSSVVMVFRPFISDRELPAETLLKSKVKFSPQRNA
jgi:hypothetical protein